jgi:serine/threonine protein kinase
MRKSSLSRKFSIKKLNSTDSSKFQEILSSLSLFRRSKISVHDYEPLKIIGRGAFGEVRVCRLKKTDEIVAIKKMKKNEMIVKN